MHKPRKHDYEDGHHQHFSNGRESMTHCPKRDYGQQEGRQRSNVAWILPFQPRRAMRTNKPSPLVHIQEKRGNNVMLANGARRHAGYPLSLFRLLCRPSSTASMERRNRKYSRIKLEFAAQTKNKGGRPRPNFSAKHARPLDAVRERFEKASALHVDGCRFSKFKLERGLRPKLDVFLARHQRNRRSGARSHWTADQRACASTGQSADQGSPAGSAADPLPVAFLVVTPNPWVRDGSDIVVLPVHRHGLQRELQPCAAHQPSGLTCVDHQPLSVCTLRDHALAVHDDRLR